MLCLEQSMQPKASFQGKCRSVNSNNGKDDHDMGQIIIQPKVSFDGMVVRKKVFLESSHQIETHLDVVV